MDEKNGRNKFGVKRKLISELGLRALCRIGMNVMNEQLY